MTEIRIDGLEVFQEVPIDGPQGEIEVSPAEAFSEVVIDARDIALPFWTLLKGAVIARSRILAYSRVARGLAGLVASQLSVEGILTRGVGLKSSITAQSSITGSLGLPTILEGVIPATSGMVGTLTGGSFPYWRVRSYLTPLAAGDGPNGQDITPDGSFFYSGGQGSGGRLWYYSVHPTTGALTYVGNQSVQNPIDIVMNPNQSATNGWFYVLSYNGNSITTFTYLKSTGIPTAIQTSYLFGPGYNVVIRPDNKFLYAADGASRINVYSINPVTGVLTYAGNTYIGTWLNNIKVHTSGKWIYAVRSNDQIVDTYAIDPVTGLLTSFSGSVAFNYPRHIAVHPSGTHMYIADDTTPGGGPSNYYWTYTINQTTGKPETPVDFAPGDPRTARMIVHPVYPLLVNSVVNSIPRYYYIKPDKTLDYINYFFPANNFNFTFHPTLDRGYGPQVFADTVSAFELYQ